MHPRGIRRIEDDIEDEMPTLNELESRKLNTIGHKTSKKLWGS